MSDASKRKEEAKVDYRETKPKLDNARRSRGVYFIGPENEARRKLENSDASSNAF